MDNTTKGERTVPAGRFKQHCLAILDEVAETHEPITITKRNKPVARIVPLKTEAEIEQEVLTRLRVAGGKVLADVETLLQPSEQLTEWPQ